jgi:DNA-directed RNA polymerase subunit RPC12/RpoP
MERAFDAAVRLLVCGHCGAPLPPVTAGQVQCQYCQSVTVVAPRDDRSLGTGAALDEQRRIADLWTQIQKGFAIHDEVFQLMDRGELPERNVDAAMRRWEEARRQSTVDPGAVGDDLLWLTTALGGFYAPRGDRVKVRALWESALEVVPERRQRQFVRGSLCRLSVVAGDLPAAQAWLWPCDPQSDDLLCDSSYRVSYACLVTAEQQFDAVLHALGPTPVALPFFFSMRTLAGVLRANAHERLGDMPAAVAQLQAMVAADPNVGGILPKVVGANAPLNLCPQSLPQALGH